MQGLQTAYQSRNARGAPMQTLMFVTLVLISSNFLQTSESVNNLQQCANQYARYPNGREIDTDPGRQANKLYLSKVLKSCKMCDSTSSGKSKMPAGARGADFFCFFFAQADRRMLPVSFNVLIAEATARSCFYGITILKSFWRDSREHTQPCNTRELPPSWRLQLIDYLALLIPCVVLRLLCRTHS